MIMHQRTIEQLRLVKWSRITARAEGTRFADRVDQPPAPPIALALPHSLGLPRDRRCPVPPSSPCPGEARRSRRRAAFSGSSCGVPQPRAVSTTSGPPGRRPARPSFSPTRTFSSNSLPPLSRRRDQWSQSHAAGALGHERGARSLRARDDAADPGYNRASPGAIAQLGERLDRTQEVGSSSLPSSIA